MKLSQLEALVKRMRDTLSARGETDANVFFYMPGGAAIRAAEGKHFLDTDIDVEQIVRLEEYRQVYPGYTSDQPIRGWDLPLVARETK